MGWESSPRRAELPPDWERIARRIRRRDRNTCQLCGDRNAREVDHRDGRHDHSDANLQTLCHECHERKTLQEAAAARRRLIDDRTRPAEQHPGIPTTTQGGG